MTSGGCGALKYQPCARSQFMERSVLHLLLGLDAFGHRDDAEGLGHADHVLDDGGVLAGPADARHERPVDARAGRG